VVSRQCAEGVRLLATEPALEQELKDAGVGVGNRDSTKSPCKLGSARQLRATPCCACSWDPQLAIEVNTANPKRPSSQPSTLTAHLVHAPELTGTLRNQRPPLASLTHDNKGVMRGSATDERATAFCDRYPARQSPGRRRFAAAHQLCHGDCTWPEGHNLALVPDPRD
jgi:hypothetical protein